MGSFSIGKIVLRSLFKKPATLMYPVVPREWQERTRGSIEIDEKACILCGICAKKCPTDAIAVSREQKTWVIERMQCVQCGSCVEACPKKCLLMDPKYTAPSTTKITDSVIVPEQPKPAPKPDAAEAKPAAAKPEAADAAKPEAAKPESDAPETEKAAE